MSGDKSTFIKLLNGNILSFIMRFYTTQSYFRDAAPNKEVLSWLRDGEFDSFAQP